jgi:hypothetical protein
MIEVLKQAYQLLLTEPHAPTVCDQLEVIFRRAIAELESQEPVAWVCCGSGEKHDIDFYEDDVNALPVGTMLYTHPPQRTEQNFCPRCGKRTNDIHTCTPPQEKNNG